MSIGVWAPQGVVIAPVATDTPGQPNVLYEAGAQILSGTVFKMWFGTKNGLCYAESTDGLAWTRYSSNPVIAHSGQVYTRLTKISSTYWLHSSNITDRKVSVWTSTDGISWTLQNTSAIISGVGGAWDNSADGVYAAGTIYDGGIFYAYYSAFIASGNYYAAGLATSPDGINFTKIGGTGGPVIHDGIISANLHFHKVGNNYYGWTQITFPGIPFGSAACPSDISRYISSGPSGPWTWIGNPTSYRIVTGEGVGVVGGQVADPSIVEANGNCYLYYTSTPDGQGTTAGYEISCAIASGIDLNHLVQTFEGEVGVPIPWGTGTPKQLVNLVNDSFSAADASNWTTLGTALGTPWIAPVFTTGKAAGSSNSNANMAFYSGGGISWPDDQWVSVKCGTQNAANYNYAWVRSSAPANSATGYVAVWGDGGHYFRIQKMVSGTATDLWVGTPTFVINTNDIVTLSVVGSTISIYNNGNLLQQVTDTAIASGSPGIGFFGTVSYASNFLAGSFSFSIGGNAGIGGATISYTGTASGSVLADSAGNYAITATDGSYTITPSLIGYTFSPVNHSETMAGANITGVNFTATPANTPGGKEVGAFLVGI